jgi:hypothetical protein
MLVSIMLLMAMVISRFAHSASESTTRYFGTLTVETMHEGTFAWLNGRVGEANYTYHNHEAKICTLNMPVVVGSMTGSGISSGTTEGLTITVISKQLNEALINGDRVNNEDWRFSTQSGSDVDGLIINGIDAEEHFILNSRKRWISWLLGADDNVPICLQQTIDQANPLIY